MNIDELAILENELYLKVESLLGTIEEKNKQLIELGISKEYKNIHQKYAELSSGNIEALKRGLFIQWYVCVEPTFLTGIDDLDNDSQEKIIEETNEMLKNKIPDYELNWMLNYYKNWSFVFEKFEKHKLFYSKIMNKEEYKLPQFEKKQMENRGQMGIYWNSLTQ